VTICVATMSLLKAADQNVGWVIVGASDRMITAGDTQFEPPQTKITQLTNSIVVMTAGDTATQTEILYQIQADVTKRIISDPTNWWPVKDVAELYVRYYKETKLKRAENAILAPLGLDRVSFLARQAQMADHLVTDLAKELINFDDLDVEAIVTGIDPTGPHIYVVEDGYLSCEDTAGFAAIGVGYWHANSELMAQGYTKFRQLPEAIFLTLAAKKRAEFAPGVGKLTDMFSIGPLIGSFMHMAPGVLEQFERLYGDTQKAITDGMKTAMEKLNVGFAQATKEAAAKVQTAEGKDISGGRPPEAETAKEEEPKG